MLSPERAPRPPAAARPARAAWALGAGFGIVLLLRVLLCTLPPAETTDILRNVGYGRAFWTHGFAVYDLPPTRLDPAPVWVRVWPERAFDYPGMALAFFALLARLSTSLVVAKLALTAIELLNALLVARLARSWTSALLYFASPASCWWVSHEGQFEPLALLFAMGGLAALGRDCTPRGPEAGGAGGGACRRDGWSATRGTLGYALLALGVQVKLFPVLLLPAFLARSRSPRALAGFALGMLPSIVVAPLRRQLLRTLTPGYWPSGYNPFAWNVASEAPFGWIPRWLVLVNAVVTYALLAAGLVLLVRAFRRGGPSRALQALPLPLFVCVLKSLGWAHFWYVLNLPMLAVAHPDADARRGLLAGSVVEGQSLLALIRGYPAGRGQWFPIHLYLHGGA